MFHNGTKALLNWSKGKGPPRQQNAEAPALRREAEGDGLAQPRKQMVWGGLNSSLPMRKLSDKGSWALQTVLGWRTRDNGYKLKHKVQTGCGEKKKSPVFYHEASQAVEQVAH